MLLKSLNNLLIHANKHAIHWRTPAVLQKCNSSTTSTINDIELCLPTFLNYDTEQSEKIVNIINTSSLENLLNYDISKARATKLQSWMKKNGLLQSPQDLLEIEGLSVKILQKFCSSLLAEPSIDGDTNCLTKTQRSRAAPFISPSIGDEQRQQIRSCVGIRIGVSSVSWARLELCDAENNEDNAPCELTDWQHHELVEKKLHLNDLVHRCLYVDHLIPEADCYLFESPQMAQATNNPNVDQQNISIQKSQISAMIGYAMCSRKHIFQQQREEKQQQTDGFVPLLEQSNKKTEPKPNVFYLRRFLTARLFSHLVGTERVSTEQTVMDLMRTYYNEGTLEGEWDNKPVQNETAPSSPSSRLSFRGNVQFPADLRYMFSHAERYHREFLGQSLLMSLAFVRLVLLQDSDSIAKVTRGSNKDNATKN